MSKKRRTRNEKMVSQEKQKHLITQNSSSEAVYSFTSSETGSIPKKETFTPQGKSSYAYVMHDVKRSITITSLLLLASVILFILIQNQIINLTNLGY